MEPMKRVIEAVIEASRSGGVVRHYLKQEGYWEGPMRRRFALVREQMANGAEGAPTVVQEAMVQLNGRYRTRYALQWIPALCTIIAEAIDPRWWAGEAPQLLDSTDGEAVEVTQVVPAVLERTAAAGCHRPYSLVTKYLHFCFPETFPIFDSQAAASIQMWSYLEFPDRELAWARFKIMAVAPAHGRGYSAILDFYRWFWDSATPEQRAELTRLAAENEAMITGRVTILDLVDKLLWQASGDPLYLGLHKAWQ